MSIIDLAPSLLHLLDIEQPAEWLGRVVPQAFAGPKEAVNALVPCPGEEDA